LPPLPEQLIEYVVSCVSGPTLCEPDAAFVPDQPPDAVQLVTLAPLHVNVEFVLGATLRGLADRLIDGEGLDDVTVTLAVCAAVPPAPVHDSVKFEFAVSAVVVCVPDVPFVPLQAPDAEQLVAFVVLHVNCEVAPELTLVGDADSVMAGTGVVPPFVTVTATVFAAEPPGPLHVSV
jgi:hypothetical protein